MSKSKIKINLICFFDIRGIIHFEFLPERTNVNQIFYVAVLKRPIDAVKRRRGELWRDRSLILDHDKAPVHSSLGMSQFLAGKSISVMEHTPYSLDLAPAYFWLFPNFKSVLKGKRFRTLRTLNHL
jgi:hypothetical protein